ncbi:uncharacterized protein si:ch211-151h10.2 isoform X2 [Takifugu flavidus]|uniref:uncharacterized protein si:ch211-151h10.2 isoform X2 n=1 Tax=Takifugu flavidus TaxID=433684 RepID=UPI002544606C|nr:uncharacterized protein si:ch211-151h10.2 isoform X2 [Takifugu flavidus]
MAPFCPGGCGVVGVSGGGTSAALSAAALRVLEAPRNVFAVVGAGRLRVLPEVLLPEAGAPPVRQQQEDESGNRKDQFLRTSLSKRPDHSIPLALALADSLLLCVLQEPLPDPGVSHIKALLSRLQAVSSPLEFAEMDRSSAAADKVQLIRGYLQQRTDSLVSLLQVQADFEASVKDMLEGLDGLWARLELLHTGVTLSKQESRGHKDLASACTDAETLSTVMCHYGKRLQSCQTHLSDSTQLLQELTWSHTHISNHMSRSWSSAESVWPELLLQSNIEQFDKVQESFLSLEQQISTFQAHLEGLGKAILDGSAGKFAHAKTTRVASLKTGESPAEAQNSTSAPASAPATDADAPRSPLSFSSTIGRLHKSGRKK